MQARPSYAAEKTRQVLTAISAQTQREWVKQNIRLAPSLAVQAQANLNLNSVLDLLRD
jgi:hypothetical protein